MLSERDLGLVSVWHPSYLLILLDRAVERSGELAEALKTGDWGDGRTHAPMPGRAGEVLAALERRDFAALWWRLRVISCWDQARAAGDAARLRTMFPRVDVQGKGLLATEGIVTLTWHDGRHVAASLSHTLHFRAYSETEESSVSDELIPLDRVRKGGVYTVFLSTGNGSELYPLNDVVRCTGFLARTPCFDFLYRSGGVCDLRGEKLHTGQAERLIAELEQRFSLFSFAMLIPARTLDRYVFRVAAGSCRAGGRGRKHPETQHLLQRRTVQRSAETGRSPVPARRHGSVSRAESRYFRRRETASALHPARDVFRCASILRCRIRCFIGCGHCGRGAVDMSP